MLAALMMVILKAMERMTLKERVRIMNRELDGDVEGSSAAMANNLGIDSWLSDLIFGSGFCKSEGLSLKVRYLAADPHTGTSRSLKIRRIL